RWAAGRPAGSCRCSPSCLAASAASPGCAPRAAASAAAVHGGLRLKVALLMGGRSAEREISLCTGRGIAQALRNLGHEVTALDAANGRLLPAAEEEKPALTPAAVGEVPG